MENRVIQLYQQYARELNCRKKAGWREYKDMKSAREVAARMIGAISTCVFSHKHTTKGCDWLRHNAALKAACKELNITSSKELREMIEKENKK